MLKNWLSKLATTIPLGWLFSHFFMWSNNAHMFTNKAFLYSSIFILVIAIIIYILGVLWLKLSDMMPEKYKKIIEIVNSILFAGAFSLTIGVFLMEPILNPTPVKLPLVIFFVVTCFILYCIKQILNTMLAIMLVFSITIFGFNLISLNMETMQAEETEEIRTAQTLQVENLAIEFKEKPNIYLFWLESYHDFATQRYIYGIDTQPAQSFLNENDFVTYDHVYTDGSHTLAAFTELYSMGSYLGGGLDKMRTLISGDENNLVFKTLHNNGYYITKLLHSDLHNMPPEYLMSFEEKLPYLNETDFDYLYLFDFSVLLPCYYFVNTTVRSAAANNLAHRVNEAMQKGLQLHEPFFISFKGGATHSGDKVVGTDWVEDGQYNEAIEIANIQLREIIENIIAQDPNSLIIVLTDHGAFRYTDAEFSLDNIEELLNNLVEHNISYEDYINDIFGGILAIRFPNGEQVDITAGHYISQRNLFTHIFAYLSNNISLLEQRNISESKFGDLILTRDGEILYE